METKLIIEALKREAEANPASKAALMVFALRERPRSTLTLVGLEHRMQREGFKYAKVDFIPLLTAMANIGIGELTRDRKGAVAGLENIRITFTSLGEAVCGDRKELQTFKLRNKFTRILPPKKPPLTPVSPKDLVFNKVEKSFQVNLEVSINGKLVHIPVPKELTNEDIMTLIGRFKVS